MKEKLQEIARKLLAHADRTTTGILGILLLIVIGLFMREQSTSEIELPPPPSKPWDTPIPNERYQNLVKNYIQVNEDITQDPKIRPLIEFNMFDLKSVKAQEELAKQMDAQVDQAERLMQAGQKEEALKLLDSVLTRKPDHVRALDLRNQIIPPPTTTPTVSPTP